eukprot:gene9839-biopygen8624
MRPFRVPAWASVHVSSPTPSGRRQRHGCGHRFACTHDD